MCVCVCIYLWGGGGGPRMLGCLCESVLDLEGTKCCEHFLV